MKTKHIPHPDISSDQTPPLHSLPDSGLLSVLLQELPDTSKYPPYSKCLLSRFGSLSAIARASTEELTQICRIPLPKARQLLAAFHLAHRVAKESLSKQRIDSPEHVHELLGTQMRMLPKESLRVILLDTRLQLIRVEEISSGTVNESIAHPRDILAPAMIATAFALILVHNHPSGDPSPSQADRDLTNQLNKAAKLLQISFLDHIILGSPDNGRTPWFSFKHAGLL